MANFYGLFLILLICASEWTAGSAADDRPSLGEIQNQLQQLTTNYISLKINLESKLTRLEELMEQKDRQHGILEEKVLRLELELLATKERETNQLATKNVMYRTCSEAHAADSSLTMGNYWIDPDGQGVGDDPIFVYCDMATGKTTILHDSEDSIDVGYCTGPGCYTREIIYNATMRQMTTLAELSNECHQSIKYECYDAPLEKDGVIYSWWNDRDGNPQYFWAGSDSSIHTCQCGIDGECINSNVKCNCDAIAPYMLNDNGVVTKKASLPITKLNFGQMSTGVHTLGRFECSGDAIVTGFPTSCEDLWKIGHKMTGFYSVMGTKMVETVYCDFTKSLGDPAFQTWIGFDGVQSTSVYFYVQRSASFYGKNYPITFDLERINTGGAMNAGNGKFTAPVTGTYFFSFFGIADMGGALFDDGNFKASLRMNGELIGRGEADLTQGLSTDTFSLQSTLYLQAGDEIWVQVDQADRMNLYDNGNHYTHFTGWLLQENVAQSLKNRL
ncbi:uncharacterized protein LOC124338251 [Daphnia pulicaria]|uniref:uncharacterized protein LOC124338251 n=1 Tax=Daphnia pulicaria TaxID=35523 RepID=UPI001EEA4867|nr:uncharacterized protein LOC124338251 [Daphnia pulicaria]